MNIVFISIAISIVMINIALTLQISLRYDLLKNLGKVQLRLFGILLFSVPFTFVDKYLEFTTKKKVVKIKIDLADKNIIFFEKLGKKILAKIYLDWLTVKLIFCQDNPMRVSVLGGVCNILLQIMGQKIQMKHKDATISTQTDFGFRHNYIQIYFDTKIMISLFDILSSVLITIIKMWGADHAEKQKQHQK